MPKVSQMIESKFLRKEDLDEDVTAPIASVSLQDMPGDSHEQRWTVSFRNLKKPMVLNTTTIRVLEKAFGDDTDDWIGKKVTVYVDPNVQFKGQVVGGLRLRPVGPRGNGKLAEVLRRDPEDDGGFNAAVPFGDEVTVPFGDEVT